MKMENLLNSPLKVVLTNVYLILEVNKAENNVFSKDFEIKKIL